jgi:hypothetical protein
MHASRLQASAAFWYMYDTDSSQYPKPEPNPNHNTGTGGAQQQHRIGRQRTGLVPPGTQCLARSHTRLLSTPCQVQCLVQAGVYKGREFYQVLSTGRGLIRKSVYC